MIIKRKTKNSIRRRNTVVKFQLLRFTPFFSSFFLPFFLFLSFFLFIGNILQKETSASASVEDMPVTSLKHGSDVCLGRVPQECISSTEKA